MISEKPTCVKVSLKGVKTVEEALNQANCNFEAQPIETMTKSGIDIPERFKFNAIVRSDTNQIIGQVGKKFKIIQNSEAFSFFDTICTKYNAQYDFVYIINNGSKIVLSARVHQPLTIRPNDEVLSYINLFNTFDGTLPLMSRSYYYRLACTNGLMVPGKNEKTIVKHIGNTESKLKEALRILAINKESITQFEQNAKLLASKILSRKQIDSFLNTLFHNPKKTTRTENQKQKVKELFESGKGNGKNTAWDLYNGYIEWIDFHRSATPDIRLTNTILGASNLKESAFQLALSL